MQGDDQVEDQVDDEQVDGEGEEGECREDKVEGKAEETNEGNTDKKSEVKPKTRSRGNMALHIALLQGCCDEVGKYMR